MFVTFKPENGDAQQWEFNPRRVRAAQCVMIEKRYGKPWSVFTTHLMQGSMEARQVLLWHLIRLDHPSLRWEDTPDFYADELEVEFSRSELEELRAAVATARGSLTEAERADALATIDGEIEKAPTALDAGKAP